MRNSCAILIAITGRLIKNYKLVTSKRAFPILQYLKPFLDTPFILIHDLKFEKLAVFHIDKSNTNEPLRPPVKIMEKSNRSKVSS